MRVPLIGVQDGRLSKEDTDFGHRCHLSKEAVLVLSEKRKLYQEVERTGKRTREACTDIVQNLPKRCREEGANYVEAVQQLGGPHQMETNIRTGLSGERHQSTSSSQASNHPGVSGPLPHYCLARAEDDEHVP